MAKEHNIRFVSPRQWERIEQWSRRKPVFALMGEFSAGKSTLMNFLLRKHALPTQVTATQLPPVWFTWGDQPAYVQRHDGSRQPIEISDLNVVGVNDAQFIRIYLEADILEAVDLIDTPGISDPNISSNVWQRAVGQANGVLWCTHATQAWRETERAMWVSLPDRLHQNSLLLVTRADALSVKDRQKVLRRVNRETGPLFNRSILFSARDAITARDKTGDADLWVRSGGGKMIDSFLEITESIMDRRADQLARYQVDRSLSTPQAAAASENLEATFAQTADEEMAERAAAPLKLMNPLLGDEAAPPEPGSVASFPVRPSRVSRRDEDETERAARARIDADEAEKLRASIVPEPIVADNAGVTEDSLRAFFRDSANDPLDLAELSVAPTHGTDEDLELAEDDADPYDDELEGAEDGADADTLSSITSVMADTPPEAGVEEEPQPQAGAEILSISSLIRNAAPESPEGQRTALDEALDVPDGALLSAATMWTAILESEELPETPDQLLDVFRVFLEEFDQIAAEHHARQSEDAPRNLPHADRPKGAEWHVL
ncbi:hypothetical protein FGK63_16230 [Ruegeria sediminis]|uniref:Dynamin N-terminal domain-containing protein n=1 Tax=Ruegeria sediminis TaxID=2583820 RepID=A0ABY2WV43_9RHOB|nr:dynamin family protein [Ruegeria sediminis]TMV05591.1 hypothetical protein FGK63_16230 [Ruegeria sediminis]